MAAIRTCTDIEGGGREHDRPVARQRGQDADEGLGHRLAAGAVGGIADQPLDGGLAHRRQQIAQHRHGVELRPRGRCMGAGLEQQIDDLPPQRGLRRIDPGGGQRRVDRPVAPRRVSMRLGAGDLVRTQRIDRGDGRADQLAHAVGDALGAGRGHHQTQQVDQEGALGGQRRAATELGVARVDRVLTGHPQREPAGLVAALRRQGLADQRNQASRGRPDIDGRG